MLISLCTPNMNRTHDLRQVMPSRLEAAAASPPVEMCIVNYNSQDDLDEYIAGLEMPEGVSLTYRHYTGREYWHMAHGFNLAVLASSGEYFWLMGTDRFMRPYAFIQVRRLLETRQDDLMYSMIFKGEIVCRKQVFVDAGGYDERFEFYGREGEELNERLKRRGVKVGNYSNHLLEVLPTSNVDKRKNYRIKGNKSSFSRLMRPIYEQCQRDQVTIANQGRDWGSWD